MLTEDSKMESNEYKIVSSAQQTQPKSKKVGQSKFYDVSSCMIASEKQDIMKPEDYIDEGMNYYFFILIIKNILYILYYIIYYILEINSLAHVQQECTIFNGVTYLGSATINAPKSECEIQRNMNILNAEQSLNLGIKVSVSVPSSSQGSVV